jgi:hypothetical protein
MARTITYRVKTPAGEWQRSVINEGALPQNITGLVAGETYQVDTGKGTLVDVTPLNTFTLETFTGTPVVTGPGAYELTITAPAYLASYNPGGGAGVYTWDTTELATGPKVLYPGSINDTAYNDGETITLVNPAFGVGSGTVDVFYRVYDDSVEVFDGATVSFDTTGRAGSSISVRSYMVDQNGESAEATILTFTLGAVLFSPSDIFTGGRDGFAMIPSTTTSFESTDNSNPAETSDAVQFQADSSGLGTPRNLTETRAGFSPVLVLDGSTYALDFTPGANGQLLGTASYQAANGTNGVSFFARIKAQSISGDRGIIGADTTVGGTGRQFQFRISNAGIIQMLCFNAAGGFVTTAESTTTLVAGTWYNVCGIWNPTNARIWVNEMDDADVEDTNTNTAGTVGTANTQVFVGSLRTTGVAAECFNGNIAFALCGNWSLSETERNDLATFASAL